MWAPGWPGLGTGGQKGSKATPLSGHISPIECIHVKIRGQKLSKIIRYASKKIRGGSKKNSTSLEFFSTISVLEFLDERSHCRKKLLANLTYKF